MNADPGPRMDEAPVKSPKPFTDLYTDATGAVIPLSELLDRQVHHFNGQQFDRTGMIVGLTEDMRPLVRWEGEREPVESDPLTLMIPSNDLTEKRIREIVRDEMEKSATEQPDKPDRSSNDPPASIGAR